VAALNNHLKRFRSDAGLSQQALAGDARISRQAYAALEAGRSSPSTEVALRLARSLGTRVDFLFSLSEERPPPTQAELIGPIEEAGHAVSDAPRRARLLRVGNRLLARPLSSVEAARQTLVDAEGLILPMSAGGNRVAVQPFDEDELKVPALGMLGCDPAVALLESGLRRYGVRLVWAEESSYEALTGLARGEGHVAGCHLRDEDSGEFNVSWVRRLVPFACTLVTFAAWQQGLMVAAGNPKRIQSVSDLANPNVTMINRQTGSGSRSLLDRLLNQQGIPPMALAGYGREAGGHLAVARAVATGLADVGIGVQAAASALGLGFVPLEEERYDLVIPNHFLDDPAVQPLLDLLRQPGLHQRIEALGGYDVSGMGLPAPAS